MNGVNLSFADSQGRTSNRSRSHIAHRSQSAPIPLPEEPAFGGMAGRSHVMREAFALLERAAASQATVLLQGETGTGKEVAARSIHSRSARGDKPFVVVDCGAIPPHLMESELFGHVRGAFTGAATSRQGLFAVACSGTIFLDEIGELSPELQPKLLRALERREIKAVGDSKYVPINVRVIAATNRDLRAEVDAGEFRSDLYYRLAVLEIRLPPLRERTEDLLPLVEHFLEELGATGDSGAPMRTEGFRAKIHGHAWPGNVRELRNYVERCLALNAQPPIASSPSRDEGALPDLFQSLKAAREAFDKRYLEALLQRHGSNMSQAARAAGVDRANLYRMLWRHQLR
jgi:two-component system, NtrC family, response regulator GlrR